MKTEYQKECKMDYKGLIEDYAKQYQATRSDRIEKMRYRGKVETRKRTEGAIPLEIRD